MALGLTKAQNLTGPTQVILPVGGPGEYGR